MKQIYRVQRMTETSFHNYMGGGYNFSVENLDILAETAEEAIKLAEKEGYVVNKGYVRTLAEIEAENARRIAEAEAKAAKEKASKERKMAREAEKANALGLTAEEYKRYKKDKAIAKKLPVEIAECEEEMKRLAKEIERKRNYLAELTAKIAKIEEA